MRRVCSGGFSESFERRSILICNVAVKIFQKPHHGVAVLEHFHFRPRRDDFQRVAFRVAKDKSSAGREQLRQIFIIEQLLRE